MASNATHRAAAAGAICCPPLLAIASIAVFVPPAASHNAYHWMGNRGTTLVSTGVRATLEVANPGVPAQQVGQPQQHFNAAVAVSPQDDPRNWLEVGWAEMGTIVGPSGNPIPVLYVYDSPGQQLTTYQEAVPLSVGDSVAVRIRSSTSCTSSSTSCAWAAQVFLRDKWRTLRRETLEGSNQGRAFTWGEVQILQQGASHFQISTFNHCDTSSANQVMISNNRRRVAGSWNLWTGGNLPVDTAPYSHAYVSAFYKFCLHKT